MLGALRWDRILCVLAFFIAFGAGQDSTDSLFGRGRKECPPFKCDADLVAVPKRPLKLTSTGSCNGLGGGSMSMFSAGKTEDVLSHCCDLRQACDQICGASLKMCNDGLEACMNATCAIAADKEECDRSASVHKLMTQLGDGCSKLVPAQTSNCQCVSPERAIKRREQVLGDLYKKYAPESMDKVSNLVEKATTPKKFAALLARLVDKYPKAIRIKKDPTAAYFENIVKQAKDKEKATTDDSSAESSDDATAELEQDLLDLDDEGTDGLPKETGGGDL